MKKMVPIIFAICMLFLTACGTDSSTIYTEVNTIEGVSLTLDEATQKSAKATFILTNDSTEDVEYTVSEYHMEQWKDDQWVEFTGTAESAWSSETTTLAAGEAVSLPIDWKTLCGSTSSGNNYRMIILVNGSPVAVEFTGR